MLSNQREWFHLGVHVGFIVALACLVWGIFSATAQAEAPCPNEALRTGLSANLPDCRAYELVTPPYKGGDGVTRVAASADGTRAIVQSLGNFGDDGNNQETEGATYELTRTSTGWSETPLDPPASLFPWDRFLDASSDLEHTLWVQRATSQSLTAVDLYVRDAGGTLHDFGPTSPPDATEGPSGLGPPPSSPGTIAGFHYRGASSDLSHVLFTLASPNNASSPNLLWPGDTTADDEFESLYEYTAGMPEPKLVGVENEGALARDSEAELIGQCGIQLGSSSGEEYNAVSESGATVLYTVTGADDDGRSCTAAQPPVDELYARIDGEKTVALSEPILPAGEKCEGACATAPHADGVFQGASRDGSKVFFLTAQPLLNGDEDAMTDLYAAEIEGVGKDARLGALTQVSHDPNAGQAAEVQGVARVSEDGSHVYFVAKGVLTQGKNAEGGEPIDGKANLYVYEHDARYPGGHTAFIATLLTPETQAELEKKQEPCLTLPEEEQPACLEPLERESRESTRDESDWSRIDSRPVQATPEGRFLVFASVQDLTPGDTSTVPQVFEYDAEEERLVRVSVGQKSAASPAGFNDNGNTTEDAAGIPSGSYTNSSPVATQSALSVSSDGAYVFFTSPDGLTPQALDNHLIRCGSEFRGVCSHFVYAENVYEYHSAGPISEGNVSLISDGQDVTETGSTGGSAESSVRLEGTTLSGEDVFFTTADPLVPQDTDTLRDSYDARIDGGFPPPSVSTSCQEEVCQGSPGAAPPFGAPASTTFSGAGNLAPAPAAALPKPKTAAQIRAEKLVKALKVCAKDKKKATRAKCQRRARKQFGAAKQAKKSSDKRRASR